MRTLLLTVALGLVAPSASAADGYVSVSARVEQGDAFRPGVAFKRESAVVVCVGEADHDDAACAPVWWETRDGVTTGRQQADRVLLREVPARDVSPYVSVVGVRVWRNDVVKALARAAAAATSSSAAAPAVDLRRVHAQLQSLAEGRRKRTRTVATPAGSTETVELAFTLDPRNRSVPAPLTVDCAAEPQAEACARPRVIVRFDYSDFVAAASTWVDPILESCRLAPGTTTTSLAKDLEAAAPRLSDAQRRAESRLLEQAAAMIEAREAGPRDPDRTAEHLQSLLALRRAGEPGALWDDHYRERADALAACVADLELYEPVRTVVEVLEADPTDGPDARLHELAAAMDRMTAAGATYNALFRDANLRRGQLEIGPMQQLERMIKNAAEEDVAKLVDTTPCARCRTLGRQWLDGRAHARTAHHDAALRATLLDTDRALQDMEHALDARQVQLASACRSYDAGHAARLLAQVREAQEGVAELIVYTTFDEAARKRLSTLRTELLGRLPEVVSTLARPVERACGTKAAAAVPSVD